MKCKMLFSFLCTLGILTTCAQNTAPYWSLAGNSGTGTTAKLGTFGADTLNLITSNKKRVQITPQGAVLVGPVAQTQFPVIGTLTVTTAYNTAAIGILSTGSAVTGVQGYGTSFGMLGQGLGTGSIGVAGSGAMNGVWGSSSNYGVYGTTEAGYGVYGYASSYGYGGYFQSQTGSAVVARTYQTNGYWAGIFYGNMYSSGSFTTSDKRLKKNITEFDDATALLRKLKPRTYEFSHEGKLARMNLPQGKHWGLIAQDVETVFPSLVAEVLANAGPSEDERTPSLEPGSAPVTKRNTSLVSPATDKETIKVLNYTELIPILIKAVQEQDEKIQELEKTVLDLKTAMSEKGIKLTGAYLEVPAPNPASSTTTVRYSIPDNTARALISIANMSGQVIKSFSVTGSGKVELNVSTLASGIYPCTLWVNGQQAVSKQLVVAH